MRAESILGQFMLFFFLMLMMWVGTAYVSQNIQYSSAGRFHSSVVQKLEDSNFAPEVMQECVSRAEDERYQLKIERSGGGSARVTLKFSYTFPVLKLNRQYVIEGYAR